MVRIDLVPNFHILLHFKRCAYIRFSNCPQVSPSHPKPSNRTRCQTSTFHDQASPTYFGAFPYFHNPTTHERVPTADKHAIRDHLQVFPTVEPREFPIRSSKIAHPRPGNLCTTGLCDNHDLCISNPPAPACQGHKAAKGFIDFLTINNHCYSIIGLCFYPLREFKSVVDQPRQIHYPGSVHRLLAIACWLPPLACPLSYAGCRLLASIFHLLASTCWLPSPTYWLLPVACWLPHLSSLSVLKNSIANFNCVYKYIL